MNFRRLKHQFFYFVVALGILITVSPFISSNIMIQLKDGSVAEIDGDLFYKSIRTVTIPSTVDFSQEVEMMLPNEVDYIVPECNRNGKTFFEVRGTNPIIVPLGCDLPDGKYIVRYCVTTTGYFGIHLLPTCLNTEFFVGKTIEERLDALEEKIEN